MATVFKDQLPGESLDHFAEKNVTTTPLERTRFGQDIDSFVRCLHSQTFRYPHSVQEVVKSGSLGKGTAVRERADIDLVVFVNGLTSIADLQAARGQLLDKIEAKVEDYLQIRARTRTKYSLSFEWKGNDVDILPAFNLLSYYGCLSNVYKAMEQFGPRKAAQEFSVSLAPFQLQFVKPVPEHVKKVIRLVKLWKEEKSLNIRSYSLELLTIFVWRQSRMSYPGTNYLFQEVMKQLERCDELEVAFDDNYDSYTYTTNLNPPFILDPANPYMNTLHGAWTDQISDCARRTLRRDPVVRDPVVQYPVVWDPVVQDPVVCEARGREEETVGLFGRLCTLQ